MACVSDDRYPAYVLVILKQAADSGLFYVLANVNKSSMQKHICMMYVCLTADMRCMNWIC